MITKELLLEQLGSSYTDRVVERLHRFIYIKDEILQKLSVEALHEDWGEDCFALKKYLAIQIPWSIEQELFTVGNNQWYLCAGKLQTRYGTPIYLIIEKNGSRNNPNRPPWYLKDVKSYISAPLLPSPPEIPVGKDIPKGVEIVMMHDHILNKNADRVEFLKDAPSVAQMCAISGSIQWSLNRGLQLPYWYYGSMQYIIPLYLRSRENIAQMPDIVATIQVGKDNLLVRTVLEPHMPYPNARVSAPRHDQLPSWLIDSWKEHSRSVEMYEETEEAEQT